MPTWPPSGATTLTSRARIYPFTRSSAIAILLMQNDSKRSPLPSQQNLGAPCGGRVGWSPLALNCRPQYTVGPHPVNARALRRVLSQSLRERRESPAPPLPPRTPCSRALVANDPSRVGTRSP